MTTKTDKPTIIDPDRAAFLHRKGENVLPRNLGPLQHRLGFAAASEVMQGIPTIDSDGKPRSEMTDEEVADRLRAGYDEISQAGVIPLSDNFQQGFNGFVEVATQPEPTEPHA